MPRHYPGTSRRASVTDIAAWQEQNAATVTFLRNLPPRLVDNAFLTSCASQLSGTGTLSPRQVSAIGRFIENETRPRNAELVENAGPAQPAPATAADLPGIFNGVYSLSRGDEHLTYRIHTVRQGPLAGKRIIKLVRNGREIGFAFVNVDGGLNLWRRFADQTDERYVQWAHSLMELLVTETVSARIGLGMLTIHSGGFDISVSTYCRRCNRRLTTPDSVAAGIGPECQSRTTSTTHAAAVPSGLTPRSSDWSVSSTARRQPEPEQFVVVDHRTMATSELGGTEVR